MSQTRALGREPVNAQRDGKASSQIEHIAKRAAGGTGSPMVISRDWFGCLPGDRRLGEHNDSNMGAALAFYTMFSIAPILVIATAVAGYVFGPQVAETQVLGQLSALIGDTGAKAIRDLLLNAHYSDQKGFAAAVGIITLLVGATSVFGELQYTLDRIWNTPPEKAVV